MGDGYLPPGCTQRECDIAAGADEREKDCECIDCTAPGWWAKEGKWAHAAFTAEDYQAAKEERGDG